MSDSAVADKSDLIQAMKVAFAELVADTLAGASGDVLAYSQQLTQEFGRYLWRAQQGDAVATGNLDDLKAQVLLIAVKRAIVVQRETMAKVQEIVDIAMRFALKALIAAM
jgi:hypothetical protein